MKRLLFLPLILTLAITANAQQFKIGAVAGIAITDVQGFNQTEIPTFRKGGAIIGGVVNTHIGNTTRMQLEISYVQRGSQIPPDSTHLNNYYLLRLNYIDVSLMVRQPIHLSINHKVSDKYGLLAGLTYGTLIYQSYNAQSVYYDMSANLNTYEANVFFGFYYNFTPNLFFDLRYSNTFLPVIKSNATSVGGVFYPYFNSWNDGNNIGFEIRLGYTFGGGSTSNDAGPSSPPPAPGQ